MKNDCTPPNFSWPPISSNLLNYTVHVHLSFTNTPQEKKGGKKENESLRVESKFPVRRDEKPPLRRLSKWVKIDSRDSERSVVSGSKAATGRQNQIVQVKILRVSEWPQERDKVVGETRWYNGRTLVKQEHAQRNKRPPRIRFRNYRDAR